jgi:TPP-dependent indolepyruvate ferredoxin oxidoreductase alpha subunit
LTVESKKQNVVFIPTANPEKLPQIKYSFDLNKKFRNQIMLKNLTDKKKITYKFETPIEKKA